MENINFLNSIVKKKTTDHNKCPLSDHYQKWPESLKEFILKSYTNANKKLNTDQKIKFNNQIQHLIKKSYLNNLMQINDWSNQKIPILDNVAQLDLFCLLLKQDKSESIKIDTTSIDTLTQPEPTLSKIDDLKYDVNTIRTSQFDFVERKRQRSERFAIKNQCSTKVLLSNSTAQVNDKIGRCQDLEKDYLRLTSKPNYDLIRPQKVLQKSLRFVLKKYQDNKDYLYLINQFKSIRQDLTVQHIQNEFSIYTYETNAKISLEHNDLKEFNLCQSQLKLLYNLKRQHDINYKKKFYRFEVEILVFRILYLLLNNDYAELFNLKLQIVKTYDLFFKTPKEIFFFNTINILYDMITNLLLGNYYRLFKHLNFFDSQKELKLVYKLMENNLIEKIRLNVLKTISLSYRNITFNNLIEFLNFKSIDNTNDFFKKHSLNINIINKETILDTKILRFKLNEIL